MTNDLPAFAPDPDPDLLARLDAFALDDPAAAFPFSARLAREQGWSRDYARKAIGEYKRFLYLCRVAGQEMTPSEQVDAVWHLHLVYTRSYWGDLCANVLRAPLHHAPTSGGPAESRRFHAAYLATLAAYEAAFGAPPPADIWPDVATRFAPRPEFWTVPKAPFRRAWRLARVKGLALAGVLGATTAAFAANKSESSAFVSFAVLAGVVALFGKAVWDVLFPNPNKKKKSGDGSGCGSSGCSSSSSDSSGCSSGDGGGGCGGGCGGGGD